MKVETRDASMRAIGITVAVVLAGTWLTLGGAWLLWRGRAGTRRPLFVQRFQHGPQDLPEVSQAWAAIDAEQRDHLSTYGWVDRPAGVVRIPIDQAMQRLAAP